MTAPTPPVFPVRDQRKVDIENLNLLSIFHFVGAGLACLGLLFLAVHFAFMHSFLEDPSAWQPHGAKPVPPPPPELIKFFGFFYALFALWFIASLILNIISAVCLRTRKSRNFSLAVAAVNCLHLPLGTVLGVFTIVVLCRDSVRTLYETASAQ